MEVEAMRIPPTALVLLTWSSIVVGAGAQTTYLQNDSYGGGAVLCYQGITDLEGLASKFTASAAQYPYTIHSIRVFGCSGGLDAYVIQIFQDNGGTAAPGPVIWSSQNAYLLDGSNIFNDILMSQEPNPPPPITSGSVRVLLVNLTILKPIGFGADLNGILPQRNTVRDDLSNWSFAENPPFNVNGDWILRLGINTATNPSLSAIDVTVPEGTGGPSDAVVTVALSPTVPTPVTVAYQTADNTAVAPGDYTATSGILTFPANTGVRTVIVPVVGDATDEPTETFTLELSNPVNAAIGDGTAIVTIQDDDAPVAISVADVETIEGDGGVGLVTFPVTLSAPSGFPVTVDFSTANGTATAPGDFTAASGLLSFAAGSSQRSVDVTIVRDFQDEPDESFTLALSLPTNATLADGTGVGLIRDDDLLVQQELVHGSEWTGSLASHPGPSADLDAYAITQAPQASYEVIVDAASGDLGAAGPVLERYDTATSSVVQASVAVGVGSGRTLRWANASTSPVASQLVRVRSAQCTTNCGADDRYRVRAWETTLRCPRFNNANSQVTVLQVQNTTGGTVAGTVWFWSAAGALLASEPLSLAPHGSTAIATSALAGLAGQSGSLTITSDAPYGALTGKAVALEPATGLTFDALLEPRPR
jgi:Calx-beta domain